VITTPHWSGNYKGDVLETTNILAIIRVEKGKRLLPHERFFCTHLKYHFGICNSVFDSLLTIEGKYDAYVMIYAVKHKPFYCTIKERTIVGVEDLDIDKYTEMYIIDTTFAYMNKTKRACFECYDFFKNRHYHHLDKTYPKSHELHRVTKNFELTGYLTDDEKL